jgi:hypothetical protein
MNPHTMRRMSMAILSQSSRVIIFLPYGSPAILESNDFSTNDLLSLEGRQIIPHDTLVGPRVRSM